MHQFTIINAKVWKICKCEYVCLLRLYGETIEQRTTFSTEINFDLEKLRSY